MGTRGVSVGSIQRRRKARVASVELTAQASGMAFHHIASLKREIERLYDSCAGPHLPLEIYALSAQAREAVDQAATLPIQSAADAIGALTLLKEELTGAYAQIASSVIAYLEKSSSVP